MKKLLAIVLATLMVVSMFAVSASAFMDMILDFDHLPAGLEGRDDVVLQQNKALKISPNAVEWGYKGIITFSDTLIDYDSTVSFWMMTNEYPDGWCHRLSLVLTDVIGKANESSTMGGIVTNGNSGRVAEARSLGYIGYSDEIDVPGSSHFYPGVTEGMTDQDFVEFIAGEWFRIDLLVNFESRTTDIYVNGAKFATAAFSPDAVGYKALKSYTVSSGNEPQDFYVDELVVREGLIVPDENDLIANQDRDAIETAMAEGEVMIYEPFDALNPNTLSNTSKWRWSVAEIDGFNQSTLLVNVPQSDIAFEDVYIPFSETPLEGNATISIQMMTQYTVRRLPGLEIKLVDADKNVIGGFIVGDDYARLMFDDGESVYAATDADGREIRFGSGRCYNIAMLLNHANHSITIYLDNVRIGTVAVEDDTLTGFTGILLSKQSTAATKPMSFTFDNLTVHNGLHAPGVGELDETDGLVQIDPTITWDVGGTVITQRVVYGTTPTPPTDTAKPEDNQYVYTFTGWDKEITAATADVTYTAQYSTVAKYKVTWNIDTREIIRYVVCGTVPTAPSNTVKKADDQYIYTFIGWDKEIVAVTEDVTYTAQYEKTVNVSAFEEKFDELYDAIAKLEEELDSTKTELENTKTALDSTKTELEDVKDELDTAKTELENAKAEFDNIKAELEKAKADIDSAMEPLNKLNGGCASASLGTVIALAVGFLGVGITVIKKK